MSVYCRARGDHGHELQFLRFRVVSIIKLIVSAEGFFQAVCTIVFSETGGC